MSLYLDSSAIVKLVQREAESASLRRFLRLRADARRVTSTLARVEVVRAVAGGGPTAIAHAQRQLGRCYQVALDVRLLDRAAMLGAPVRLRSLDAIHLASAQLLGDGLEAVVTYDQRMVEAAAAVGMPVASPA